jgi:hypothetical protein
LGFRYLLHDFYWSASRALGPARIKFSLEGARVGRVFLPICAAAGPVSVLPSRVRAALGVFLSDARVRALDSSPAGSAGPGFILPSVLGVSSSEATAPPPFG